MKNLILIVWLFGSLQAFSQGSKKTLQNLNGTYKSVSVEDWGGGTFGFREFSFEKGKWTLRFTLALDPQMQNKVFEFRTLGSYKVLSESKSIKAYEAVFYEDKKFVTLKTENSDLIKAFGLADCALTPFIEKDISVNGCAIWPSVENCNEDHDLLSLDERGLLYFGVRPADNNMCSADKRPTALLPPVAKQ